MNTNDSKIVFLIGRILVGSFYLYTGLSNFIHLAERIGYATFKGVPMPTLAVSAASSLLVIAGLSIFLGYRPVLGVTTIVLFLVPVTLLMHNFWTISDPQLQEIEFHSFLGNMGLAGSALFFLAIPRPWLLSLDELLARQSYRNVKPNVN
jgi:putative oxidoreductase